MVRRGEALKLDRGVYHRLSHVTELDTIAAVCARVPEAVVCLLSALAIHEIGTQLPADVWIAVDRKARKPRFSGIRVTVVRFSGRMLTYAVETRDVQGVKVRITSPARTVVDCFRYRHKIGIDIALEALKDAVRSRRASVDAIMRAAQVCRISTVIRPYLEAVLA